MRFILIPIPLFLSVAYYLYARVLEPLSGSRPVFWFLSGVALILFGSIFWWILVYVRSTDLNVSRAERFLERTTHLSMGLLSQLLFVTVVRDLLYVVLTLMIGWDLPTLSGALSSAVILGLTLTLFVLSIFQTLRGPELKQIQVTDPRVKKLRIVQLSDLHIGPWIGANTVEKIVRRIESLGPIDLFVLTGDIGDGNADHHKKDLEPFRRIDAKYGKFSVTGNHEGYWDEELWSENIEELGFKLLDNDSVRVTTEYGPISIHGMSDQSPDKTLTFAGIDPNLFSLFLVHQPKHVKTAIEFGASLQLSGHTHAGQFVPWSLLIGLFHEHPKGLYRVDKTHLYVHSGTGFWGPPLRLGARAEIAVIEVSNTV